MLKKILFILSAVLLTACSSTTQTRDEILFSNFTVGVNKTFFEKNKALLVNPKPGIISPECENIAKYGRSVAVLKEAGIPSTSLEEYMTTPAVTKIPMRTIQFYVISRDNTPGQIYADLLLTCHKVGWDKLEKLLKDKTPAAVDELKMTKELSSIR